MTLIDQLSAARVFDLEQPRFAGMPVHPAHKPDTSTACTGAIATPIAPISTARDPAPPGC